MKNDVISRAMQRQSTRDEDDEEEASIWAPLEKFPTYDRLRASILTSVVETESNTSVVHRMVDVEKLDSHDRREFMERVLKVAEEDHGKLLRKITSRIDKCVITTNISPSRFIVTNMKRDCVLIYFVLQSRD